MPAPAAGIEEHVDRLAKQVQERIQLRVEEDGSLALRGDDLRSDRNQAKEPGAEQGGALPSGAAGLLPNRSFNLHLLNMGDDADNHDEQSGGGGGGDEEDEVLEELLRLQEQAETERADDEAKVLRREQYVATEQVAPVWSGGCGDGGTTGNIGGGGDGGGGGGDGGGGGGGSNSGLGSTGGLQAWNGMSGGGCDSNYKARSLAAEAEVLRQQAVTQRTLRDLEVRRC
jgi:hypothetical protein